MELTISASSSLYIHLHKNPIFLHSSSAPSILSYPPTPLRLHRFCALKISPDGGRVGTSSSSSGGGGGKDVTGTRADLLRKPVVSPEGDAGVEEASGKEIDNEDDGRRREEDGWVDWEDQILEDTVPLVGFVRMILHSGKYESGERLSPEHERTILERLLPHHPECEKKIGCGVDYITIGYHPDFESSRCLFIVRKDGELVDFSYWKCIKGLIRKNYPLYADSFILRHFRRRRRND